MMFKDHIAFTLGIIADRLGFGARPTEPVPETVPDFEPQPPEPQPDEPLPFDPDPFPDYRDVPPMVPIGRGDAGG
jgi:hypothetical protein